MNKIEDFYNIGKDCSCMVCGTAPSLSGFIEYHDIFYTIGVNDVVKYFTPNILLISDNLPPNKKYQEKLDRIINNKSTFTFSYKKYDYPNSKPIYFEFATLHNRQPESIFKINQLCAIMTSVEIAISLSIYMGFKYIGIIGWDIKDHGAEHHLDRIDDGMAILNEYANNRGQLLYNLSDTSLVRTVPKMNLQKFIRKYSGESAG